MHSNGCYKTLAGLVSMCLSFAEGAASYIEIDMMNYRAENIQPGKLDAHSKVNDISQCHQRGARGLRHNNNNLHMLLDIRAQCFNRNSPSKSMPLASCRYH